MTVTSYQYHESSSYQRNKMTPHFLDWENQPSVFKTYPDSQSIRLPEDVGYDEIKLSSILRTEETVPRSDAPNLLDLSNIFGLTYRITAKSHHGRDSFYYRSVASAGALYPVEVYVACSGVRDLKDGLYHFSIASHGLTLLRKGNTTEKALAALRPRPEKPASMIFFMTAIYFRSAWKYRNRAYRYHLMDTGHLVENLTLSLRAMDLSFALSYDFDDRLINRLLGLDETKEVCLAICHVSGPSMRQMEGVESVVGELPESFKAASKVARNETDYVSIREIHESGSHCIIQPENGYPVIEPIKGGQGQSIAIPFSDDWPETMNYSDAFINRRSKRNYLPKPITNGCLSALIESLIMKGPETFSSPIDYNKSVRVGIIVRQSEEFDPGIYLLDDTSNTLKIFRHGSFTEQMARICLNQQWLANAAVHFLFISDLNVVEKSWGARGYRYAMMTAGRLGERLYLVSTALGLGCCGIGAFYDSEAAQIIGLSDSSRMLYLVSLGPVKSL